VQNKFIYDIDKYDFSCNTFAEGTATQWRRRFQPFHCIYSW